jgi:hypothetical protein
MHEEIVVQKMHQVTPLRTHGAFADRPCGNPQCRKCLKPRHNTVGFCSATQRATIITNDSEVDAKGNFDDPILLNKEADAESNFADPILPNKEAERSEQSERASMLSSSSPMSSSPPVSSRTPSPPRNIAARTPWPPTVIKAPNDPFTRNVDPLHIHMMRWQVNADAKAEEALIRNGSAVTQEDCVGHAERRQNDKKVMKNDYSQQYEKKKLLEEQRQRRIFSDLQQLDNRKKLRLPVNFRRYTPVHMGLPLTSEERISESKKWHGEHEEERIIDVVSPKHDRTDEYYFEGTRLYQVPRTDESYEREDCNLAASLRRNAAVEAATAATGAWE